MTAGIVLAVIASALIAFSSPSGVDYLAPPCPDAACDDAGPSIEALSHGDLNGFFDEQPIMGSVSLLLRTPPTMLAHAVGGDDLLVYRFGVFVCLLAAGLLAVFLAVTMIQRGRPWMLWALLAAACLINPLTYQAAFYGHPEESLAAALVVGAVIAAGRGKWLIGGLMLGAAVATKQWALLAVLPTLIAAPAGTRVRVALTCAALAATLILPMAAGNPERFRAAQERVSVTDAYTNTVTATNVWWPFATASTGQGIDIDGSAKELTQYSLPGSAGRVMHLAVIAAALLLCLLYARRRGRGNPEDLLQLVALLFLARCMLDPVAVSDHHLPFLMVLISFEALRRQVPVLSAYTIAAVLLMNEVVAPSGEPWLINAVYLAWTFPLAGALALSLFAPHRYEALGRRLTARLRPVSA
jgi:glycosyl transferase family 87